MNQVKNYESSEKLWIKWKIMNQVKHYFHDDDDDDDDDDNNNSGSMTFAKYTRNSTEQAPQCNLSGNAIAVQAPQ